MGAAVQVGLPSVSAACDLALPYANDKGVRVAVMAWHRHQDRRGAWDRVLAQ